MCHLGSFQAIFEEAYSSPEFILNSKIIYELLFLFQQSEISSIQFVLLIQQNPNQPNIGIASLTGQNISVQLVHTLTYTSILAAIGRYEGLVSFQISSMLTEELSQRFQNFSSHSSYKFFLQVSFIHHQHAMVSLNMEITQTILETLSI